MLLDFGRWLVFVSSLSENSLCFLKKVSMRFYDDNFLRAVVKLETVLPSKIELYFLTAIWLNSNTLFFSFRTLVMNKHSYSSRISQSSERNGDETTSLKLTDQVYEYLLILFLWWSICRPSPILYEDWLLRQTEKKNTTFLFCMMIVRNLY